MILTLTLGVAIPLPADEPAYRTDAGPENLPWYQLKPGEFPPPGSAHAISGELIGIDHVNRKGVLRGDRNGSQRTDDYDKPVPFAMLPYGSVYYHGAPAEVRDIPIGTHLHGEFYQEEQAGKKVFYRVLRLEDDFSHAKRLGRLWRVEEMNADKRTLTVKGIDVASGQADEKPTVYQISPATRVWARRAIGSLKDVAAGQQVMLNLTVCTLKGPGRVTDVWTDAESRETASAVQLERHRLYQREHGLAGWVEEVDNKNKVVTVTLFDGVEPALRNEYKVNGYIAGAVAEETLRTHDQINDTARGPIVEVIETTSVPGSSGVRIRFRPEILLEGYRPGRIVRLFGPGWRVDDLPREEAAYEG